MCKSFTQLGFKKDSASKGVVSVKEAVFVRIFDPEFKAFYTNARWFAMAVSSFLPVESRKSLSLHKPTA